MNFGGLGSINIPAPAPRMPGPQYGPSGSPTAPNGQPNMPGYHGTGNVDFGDPGLNSIWGARPDYQGITNPNGQLYNGFSVGNIGDKTPWLAGVMGGKDFIGPNGQRMGQPGMLDTASGAGTALGAMSKEVLNPDGSVNTSASPWAMTAMNAAGGNAMTGAQGNMMSGMDAMAQRGGLSGGAAERMGTAATAAGTNAYMGARQGILGQDQAYKQNLLGQLPGMQENYSGFKNAVGANAIGMLNNQGNWQSGANTGIAEFNTGNAIGDVGNKNNFGMGTWGQMGQIWGNNQVAQGENALANRPNPGMFGNVGGMGNMWNTTGDAGTTFYNGMANMFGGFGSGASAGNPSHW